VADLDLAVVGDAAVEQRLVEALVALDQLDVLADEADRDLALGLGDLLADRLPGVEPRAARPDVEQLAELVVEALLGQHQRQPVDGVDVDRLEHRVARQRAEHRGLLDQVGLELLLAADDQHVGGDADLAQLLDRVLGRLGLELAGGADVRHQREVHRHRLIAIELGAQLAHRLEERQALDVADGAADLDDQQVEVLGAGPDARLDLVGDVRDDLHRRAEVLAAPLLADHRRVHLGRW
jgi:hypothetical protein